jgi:S1-C subfamily serine protease
MCGQPVGSAILRVFLVAKASPGGGSRGSAFVLKVDGDTYLITAKHVITGLLPDRRPNMRALEKDENVVELQLFLPHSGPGGSMTASPIPVKFKTIDTESGVDVVVLVPPPEIADLDGGAALAPAPSQSTIGEDCFFLGFPFGEENRFVFKGPEGTGTPIQVPFVRKCILSAVFAPQNIWILDGFINAGFSGGPVLVRGPSRLFDRVRAILSFYRLEDAQLLSSGVPVPGLVASVNSGFVYAFDIDHAVKAIRRAKALDSAPEKGGRAK